MAGVFATLMVPMFFIGMLLGTFQGSNNARKRVIIHFIERPKLCKEEYDVITTQTKIDNYQSPEIK